MTKEVPHLEKSFAAIVIILTAVLIFVLAYITDTALPLVFLSLIPSYLQFILLMKLFHSGQHRSWIIWVSPALLGIMFLILWMSESVPLISAMEGPTIALLNIFVSYLMNIIYLHEFREEKWRNSLDKEIEKLRKQVSLHEHAQQKQQVSTQLRTIEDKCKAMNFVIGRVYSDKRGGSPDVRRTLRIDPQWYNRFSQITLPAQGKEKITLRGILTLMLRQLELLEKSEQQVVMVKPGRIPLQKTSSSTVLSILATNDKDPVKEYHAQAKETVKQLLQQLDEEEKTN